VNGEQSPLERSLAALNAYLFGGRELKDTLEEISRRALEALPTSEFVAAIVALNGEPRTPVYSDVRAYELDQVQYAAGHGPCLDSFRDIAVYVIDDCRQEERWPAFCEAAVSRKVLSTLSLPLAAADVPLGAMNLYSSEPESFGDVEERLGRTFASQASILLANAQAYHDAHTLSDNLSAAMKSRAVIEQAKGIIMGSTGCTADEAFDQLTRQSQHENIKLRDIAAEIVRRSQRRRVPP
jgi:GAF domain-containing protein